MSTIVEDTVIRTVVVNGNDLDIVDSLVTSTIIAQEDADVVVDSQAETIVIETTDRDVVSEGIQGPPGIAGIGVLQIDAGPVSAGNTLLVDQVSVALFRSVKWLLTVKELVGPLYSYSEVAAIHDDLTAAHWRAGKLGDNISVEELVDISSGFLRLRMTNNHTEDLSISVLRLGTLN